MDENNEAYINNLQEVSWNEPEEMEEVVEEEEDEDDEELAEEIE